jgi:hypothetical protein
MRKSDEGSKRMRKRDIKKVREGERERLRKLENQKERD